MFSSWFGKSSSEAAPSTSDSSASPLSTTTPNNSSSATGTECTRNVSTSSSPKKVDEDVLKAHHISHLAYAGPNRVQLCGWVEKQPQWRMYMWDSRFVLLDGCFIAYDKPGDSQGSTVRTESCIVSFQRTVNAHACAFTVWLMNSDVWTLRCPDKKSHALWSDAIEHNLGCEAPFTILRRAIWNIRRMKARRNAMCDDSTIVSVPREEAQSESVSTDDVLVSISHVSPTLTPPFCTPIMVAKVKKRSYWLGEWKSRYVSLSGLSLEYRKFACTSVRNNYVILFAERHYSSPFLYSANQTNRNTEKRAGGKESGSRSNVLPVKPENARESSMLSNTGDDCDDGDDDADDDDQQLLFVATSCGESFWLRFPLVVQCDLWHDGIRSCLRSWLSSRWFSVGSVPQSAAPQSSIQTATSSLGFSLQSNTSTYWTRYHAAAIVAKRSADGPVAGEIVVFGGAALRLHEIEVRMNKSQNKQPGKTMNISQRGDTQIEKFIEKITVGSEILTRNVVSLSCYGDLALQELSATPFEEGPHAKVAPSGRVGATLTPLTYPVPPISEPGTDQANRPAEEQLFLLFGGRSQYEVFNDVWLLHHPSASTEQTAETVDAPSASTSTEPSLRKMQWTRCLLNESTLPSIAFHGAAPLKVSAHNESAGSEQASSIVLLTGGIGKDHRLTSACSLIRLSASSSSGDAESTGAAPPLTVSAELASYLPEPRAFHGCCSTSLSMQPCGNFASSEGSSYMQFIFIVGGRTLHNHTPPAPILCSSVPSVMSSTLSESLVWDAVPVNQLSRWNSDVGSGSGDEERGSEWNLFCPAVCATARYRSTQVAKKTTRGPSSRQRSTNDDEGCASSAAAEVSLFIFADNKDGIPTLRRLVFTFDSRHIDENSLRNAQITEMRYDALFGQTPAHSIGSSIHYCDGYLYVFGSSGFQNSLNVPEKKSPHTPLCWSATVVNNPRRVLLPDM